MARLVNSKPKGGDWLGPLHLASGGRRLHCMRLLLLHGAEVNKGSSSGSTPLHEAAANGHCEGTAAPASALWFGP